VGNSYGYATDAAYDDAVAGNGLGLRAAEAYDAQATGSALEGCTYDALPDGSYDVGCVSSCAASAATVSDGIRDGVSG